MQTSSNEATQEVQWFGTRNKKAKGTRLGEDLPEIWTDRTGGGRGGPERREPTAGSHRDFLTDPLGEGGSPTGCRKSCGLHLGARADSPPPPLSVDLLAPHWGRRGAPGLEKH